MIASFSCIYISQGNVATKLGLTCGEIFNNHFIANCPQNVTVKEFWKSVNIWQRYRQSHSETFFKDTVYIYRVGQKTRTCLSVDNSAMVTRRKVCGMSKVLECCRQKGPNLRSKSFKYPLPNLHKFSLPLKLGICLHSHVSEFTELKNSLPKSPDLNYVNYSVWGHCYR